MSFYLPYLYNVYMRRLKLPIANIARSPFLLPTAIILLIIVRWVALPLSPPGFYADEAASGAHVAAMLQTGTNALDEHLPLFSKSLGGGYTTPLYLYPLVAWGFVFGTDELALRSFSLFVTLMSIGMLALAVRYWLNQQSALLTALVALALPWNWVQGSLSWDPALIPLLVSGTFLSFSSLYFSTRRYVRFMAHIGLTLAIVGLAYTYPPCRVAAPLLLLLFYGTLLYRKKVLWQSTVCAVTASALLVVPLLQFMLEPESLERARQLSVFSHTSIYNGLIKVITNTVLLLDPFFLFIGGDANLRHATGFQGMLGWAALVPFVASFYVLKEPRPPTDDRLRLLLIVWCAIGLSLLGSALTQEYQPHSLRATAAWPFFIIVIVIGWIKILRSKHTLIIACTISLFIVSTSWYVYDFIVHYPLRATSAFSHIAPASPNDALTPDGQTLVDFYYQHKY